MPRMKRLLPILALMIAPALVDGSREDPVPVVARVLALEEEILALPDSQRAARMVELTEALKVAREIVLQWIGNYPEDEVEYAPVLRDLNSKIYWCRKFTPLHAAVTAPQDAARDAEARRAFDAAERLERDPSSRARAREAYIAVAGRFDATYWGREASVRAEALAPSRAAAPTFDATAAERSLLTFAADLPDLLKQGRLAEAIEDWESLRKGVPEGHPLAASIDEAGVKLLLVDRLYARAYGNAPSLVGKPVAVPTVDGTRVEGTLESVGLQGLVVRQRGIALPVRFTALSIDAVIALATADGSEAGSLASGATLILLGRAGEARAHLGRAGTEPLARAFLREIPADAVAPATNPGEPPAAVDRSNPEADQAIDRARRYLAQKNYRNVLRYVGEFLDAADDEALAAYIAAGTEPSILELVHEGRTACERCHKTRLVTCVQCGGDGEIRPGNRRRPCPNCAASGKVACDECPGRMDSDRFRSFEERIFAALPPCERCASTRLLPCPTCDGRGRRGGPQGPACPTCEATGQVPCGCVRY